VGDTITLPDTTVVNIINNYFGGEGNTTMIVYLDSNISYLTNDILVFSYTPRSEWKFNSNSSATFPGNLGVGIGTGVNSIINVPSPAEKLVVGGDVYIKGADKAGYGPLPYPYGGGVLYGSEIDVITQTTNPVGIHSIFPIQKYLSVDYTIISNAEQVVKISAIKTGMGSSIYSEVYSAVNSGISTFSVDISGDNIRLVAYASTSTPMTHIVNYVATKRPDYSIFMG
jgi:hypothetical protein